MQNFSSTPNRKMDPVIVFYNETRENKFLSHKEGRPIYDDIEMVRITFPADRQRTLEARAHASAMVHDEKGRRTRKVNGRQVTYAELYREQYRQFKANEAPTVRGTPLSEATFLTEGKRRSLRALEVYTIEQLAAANGKSLGMGGVELVEQAKAYLDKAAGTADVTKMAADNAALRAEVERLRAENEARANEVSGPKTDDADPYEGFSDEELKAEILARGGSLGPGRQSRERLIATLEEVSKKDAA